MYYDNNFCGCGSFQNNYQPFGGYTGCGCPSNTNSSYAIVLVLFILLVIVIGSRFTK